MASIVSKRVFYGYIFLGILLLVSYYFSGPIAAAKTLGIFFVYFLIFYCLHWVFRSIMRREAISPHHFFTVFAYKVSIICSFIFIIIGGFAFYQNNINPAKLPLYTISNGEKTLIFQTMSHIAQKDFYKEVQISIARAKLKGGVLFFEGVGPGTQKNKEIFDQALGVSITPDLYESFSKIYGVTHQNNNDFLGIRNDKDYNIDLNIDQIVEIYLQKIPEEKRQEYVKSKKESVYDEILRVKSEDTTSSKNDLPKELMEQISQFNSKQLLVIQYVNKSILNFIIKNNSFRNFIVQKLDIGDIFSVILDDRNAHITKSILDSEEEIIFAMYGLMHFDGILQQLQEIDPNWEIVNTEYSYPITYPSSFLKDFGL